MIKELTQELPPTPESLVLWECTSCQCRQALKPPPHACLSCGHSALDHQRSVYPPTWKEGYITGLATANDRVEELTRLVSQQEHDLANRASERHELGARLEKLEAVWDVAQRVADHNSLYAYEAEFRAALEAAKT